MFKELGSAIARHPWAVVAFWILLMVVAIPFMPTFMSNLKYDTQSFIPTDLPANIANAAYDQQFPGKSSNQIIVVVSSRNKTATMGFIRQLDRNITADPDIKNVSGTMSIYSMQNSTLVNMTPDVYEKLNEYYDNASQGNKDIYDAIDGITDANKGLYEFRDAVCGMSDGMHKGLSGIRTANQMLYGARDMVYGTSAMLYSIKNNVTDPVLTNNSSLMENYVVGQAMMISGRSSASDRVSFTMIYRLGPHPSDAAVEQMVLAMAPSMMPKGMSVDASDLKSIYDLGRSPSDLTLSDYIINKAGSGKNQTERQFIREAWGLVYMTGDQVDSYVLQKLCEDKNASDRQNITEIYGLGENPSQSVVANYTLGKITADMNDTTRQYIYDSYDLGRNASNETIREYLVKKAGDEMNMTGNLSYFAALLSIDRNLTDDQLKGFAARWASTHDYTDPDIFPDSTISGLTSNDTTIYMVSNTDDQGSDTAQADVKLIREHIKGLQAEYPDVTAYVTGSSALNTDSQAMSMSDVGIIDKISIVLILLLLALYFRSAIAPFLPLTIIGIALMICFGVMGLISTQMNVWFMVMIFMIVIMLGAGTDYCVFMLSRYMEERSKGHEVRESVVTAVANAGRSIASSGTTAMIGFSALMLVDSGLFRGIGMGSTIAIFFCLAAALTLVPAVLTICGDRIFWPRKIYRVEMRIGSSWWARWTRGVLKNSKLILVLALLLTVPALYLYSQIHLGNDAVSMMPTNVESRTGFDLLDSEFGSGAFARAMVVMTLPELKDSGNYSNASLDQVEQVSAMVAAEPGIDKVYSITRPAGTTIDYTNLSAYSTMEAEYYKTYMDNNTGVDDRTTVLFATFNGSPYSTQAQSTIDDLRAKFDRYNAENNTTLLLGGASVGTYEYQKMCTDRYPLVIAVVVIGILAVLVMLLRSVFTPLRLICTLFMSICWTLGAFVLVFQFGLQASISWIVPMQIFCVLMGLGVDYDIFLVSRIREEVLKGKSEEDAIVDSVSVTGTIITLCGAVMAATFGSMMVSSSMQLKEFGFVLCLAIILDATVMRLVVVPAIMVLMKKYNWWMPSIKKKVAEGPRIKQ